MIQLSLISFTNNCLFTGVGRARAADSCLMIWSMKTVGTDPKKEMNAKRMGISNSASAAKNNKPLTLACPAI